MANMNGTTESGTNGAAQVKLGAPYKAYTAEQVNARQVVVIGVYQDVARYKQVGAYMRESTEAIEKVGLGPGMNLTVGGANTKLPTVVFLADDVRPQGWVENFAEVQIGLEGAETMVELRGEWKERIEIEAAVAEAVAISQNWKKTSGETIPVHIEPNAARFGVEMRDVAAVGFEAGEDKVKIMIEALSKEAAYGGLRHWGLVGGGGQSGLAAGTWFSPLKKIAFPGTKVLNVIGFDMASFQGNGGLGRPLGVLRGELGNVTIAKAIKQPGCVKTARVTVNFPLKEFASVERQLAACTKKALEGHPITVGLESISIVSTEEMLKVYKEVYKLKEQMPGGSEVKDKLESLSETLTLQREQNEMEARNMKAELQKTKEELVKAYNVVETLCTNEAGKAEERHKETQGAMARAETVTGATFSFVTNVAQGMSVKKAIAQLAGQVPQLNGGGGKENVGGPSADPNVAEVADMHIDSGCGGPVEKGAGARAAKAEGGRWRTGARGASAGPRAATHAAGAAGLAKAAALAMLVNSVAPSSHSGGPSNWTSEGGEVRALERAAHDPANMLVSGGAGASDIRWRACVGPSVGCEGAEQNSWPLACTANFSEARSWWPVILRAGGEASSCAATGALCAGIAMAPEAMGLRERRGGGDDSEEVPRRRHTGGVSWTIDEDLMLVAAVRCLGTDWCAIRERGWLGGRGRNATRLRYRWLTKWRRREELERTAELTR